MTTTSLPFSPARLPSWSLCGEDHAASVQKHVQCIVQELNDNRSLADQRQQLLDERQAELCHVTTVLDAERAHNETLVCERDQALNSAITCQASLDDQRQRTAFIRLERDTCHSSLTHLVTLAQDLMVAHSAMVELLEQTVNLAEQERRRAVEAEEKAAEYLNKIKEVEEEKSLRTRKLLSVIEEREPPMMKVKGPKRHFTYPNPEKKLVRATFDSSHNPFKKPKLSLQEFLCASDDQEHLHTSTKALKAALGLALIPNGCNTWQLQAPGRAQRINRRKVDKFSQLPYDLLHYLTCGYICFFVFWVLTYRSDIRLGWLA